MSASRNGTTIPRLGSRAMCKSQVVSIWMSCKNTMPVGNNAMLIIQQKCEGFHVVLVLMAVAPGGTIVVQWLFDHNGAARSTV